MRLEEDSLRALQDAKEVETKVGEAVTDDNVDLVNEELDQLEMSSQTNETVDASYADDVSSQQSWMLRSLSAMADRGGLRVAPAPPKFSKKKNYL